MARAVKQNDASGHAAMLRRTRLNFNRYLLQQQVYFDSALSFKPFVQKTAAAATFHIRSLGAIRDHLPRDLVRLLCASLEISRLDYCNAVFTGHP